MSFSSGLSSSTLLSSSFFFPIASLIIELFSSSTGFITSIFSTFSSSQVAANTFISKLKSKMSIKKIFFI